MKVLELRGPLTQGALTVFSTLILGLKMLPMHAGESWEDFLARMELMPDEDREKMIRSALDFVVLKPEDIEGICCFAADANGVPYGPANLKSLGLKEILDIIVAVSLEIARIRVGFVTDAEKKNLKISPSTSEKFSQSTQH